MYNQKLTEQLKCNGFHIFLLYGTHEYQKNNIQRAVIVSRVVFCPEKFMMRPDMTKRRKNPILEGTTTWIYGEKKETLQKSRI